MKLIIEDDEGRKTVVPFVRDEISIGRNEGNTIRLTERNVSRRHARFVRGNGHVFIEDLGSYNGVRINGDSVQGRAEVQEGDLIEIGDYNLAVQAEAGELTAPSTPAAEPREITSPGTQVPTTPAAQTAAPPPPAAPPPAAAAPPPPSTDHEPTVPTARAAAPAMELPEAHSADLDIPEPRPESTAIIKVDFDALGKKAQERQLEAGEQPSLVVISTEYAGQTYVLDRSLVSIGRTDENDIQLDHRSMSRRHCRIFLDEEGTWKVADLGSANGVRVNGEEYGLIEVRPGDFIELGHLKIRFCAPGEDYVYVPDDEDGGFAAGPAPSEKPRRAAGAGVPLPLVIGGGALFLMIAVGGIWAVFGGGDGDETPDPGGDTQPIADPRLGTDIDPPTPVPTTDPDPDPGTRVADSGEALRQAIQTASEAVERQDWPAAVSAYEKALSLENGNAAAQAGLKQASLENEAHKSFARAKDLLAEERFIEAAQGFDAVPPATLLTGDAKTQATYARRRAAERMSSDARAAMDIKDYEGAITVAESWLELDPKSREAQKLADRARAARRKATARPPPKPKPKRDPVVKKDPPKTDTRAEEATAAQAKGVQFLQNQKFELAAKQLERAVKLDPRGQSTTHKLLGICYARLGNKDLAAKHYRLYVKKNPSAADAAKVRQILSKYDASKAGGG